MASPRTRAISIVVAVIAAGALLVTITASMVTLAYRAGDLVGGVRWIAQGLEKVDVRLGRVETTQAAQGTDIAVIKAQLGAPLPTVVTRSAPRR